LAYPWGFRQGLESSLQTDVLENDGLTAQREPIQPLRLTVTWTNVTNRAYTLERAANLGALPAFSLAQSNIAGLPDATSWTDTNTPSPGPRFYRVRVEK
jgi:hypothetical protein